jgi:hypothetical protein
MDRFGEILQDRPKRGRAALILLAALAALLTGCALPPAAPPRETRSSAPAPLPASPETRQCLAALAASGARFTPLPDRRIAPGCTNLGTVQLQAMRGDLSNLAVTNLGPVTCPVASAFAAWARFGVDRAAREVFGSPLASIQTYGSYACRNVAGTARLSAHARAAAIDVASFILEDGRRISVREGWGGTRSEQRFLRLVQGSACRRFDTVLGPDYNADHRDHFHLEGVISGTSFCR